MPYIGFCAAQSLPPDPISIFLVTDCGLYIEVAIPLFVLRMMQGFLGLGAEIGCVFRFVRSFENSG